VAKSTTQAKESNVPAREVLPDSTPGSVLLGAPGLRELTQAGLAAKVGVPGSHISEMERGKRPVGKDMARRLGKTLDLPWKAFL
jgi:plasmid maintenance system antidote protein VapI